MIDQTALEQGNATYSEIVAEGKRLVDFLRAMHPQMTPRPVQHGGGVELVPVLHSIRTAVSASRSSRLRRSPLRGETRRRSA